ncbi:Formin-like protein 1 [Halotydeus destructor]|nr:Formin-like protein 1 [Halotydeus destructor]
MAVLQQNQEKPADNAIIQWRSRVSTITEAARILRQSEGIRTILKYVLVFGNYMNSSTRTMATGLAYGFKLTTLDLISDTKSPQDRTKSLLHYVVEVIGKNFKDADGLDENEKMIKTLSAISPTSANKKFGGVHSLLSGAEQITLDNTKLPFDLESSTPLLEKAVIISLETCISEISELEKSMELAKRELSLRQNLRDAATQRLQQFVVQKGPEIDILKKELKLAQSEFSECAEYFGENTKTMESSSTLFVAFSRFLKNYKQCLYENRLSQRKKLESLIQEKIQEHQKRNSEGSANGDASLNGKDANEAKVREKRILKQDEVYNGALEDILLGLKNEPYRRADAVRRSQRRKAENVRLSQSEMDI